MRLCRAGYATARIVPDDLPGLPGDSGQHGAIALCGNVPLNERQNDMKTTDEKLAARLKVRGANRRGGATIGTPDDCNGLHRVIADTYESSITKDEPDMGMAMRRSWSTVITSFPRYATSARS